MRKSARLQDSFCSSSWRRFSPCYPAAAEVGQWIPYGPITFRTPPFAEYVSGHSVFAASAAEILKRFTGSDSFGHSVTVKAGSGAYEPGLPAADLTLSWATFSAAADESGISRRYGGYHFEQGDLDGREMGRTSPVPSG